MEASISVKQTNDKAALVAPEINWLPITPETPFGMKMLLINKKQGVALVSYRRPQDVWTHWFPLPTFKKEL